MSDTFVVRTKKEMFDKVSKHLLAQNARCMENLLCRYRNSEGMKCAIGALIPDELYSPSMEGCIARQLNQRYNLWPEELNPLAADLQDIHDCRDVSSWKEELLRLKKLEKIE